MPKEQIVGIAVRLFAIYLALETLRYASGLLPYAGSQSPNNISLAFIATLAIFPLLAAFLLWRFPLSVASKLIPEIQHQDQRPTLSSIEIQTIAFSILGVWVLTTSIRDSFYWITFVYQIKKTGLRYEVLPPDKVGDIVATIIELIIGFYLLFGSRGLAGFIHRIRQA